MFFFQNILRFMQSRKIMKAKFQRVTIRLFATEETIFKNLKILLPLFSFMRAQYVLYPQFIVNSEICQGDLRFQESYLFFSNLSL